MTPTEFEDSGIALALWLLRLALIVAFAVLIYFIMSSFANAVECKSEPNNRGAWAWRYIEPHQHRKCWYAGRHVLPKSHLHWPATRIDKLPTTGRPSGTMRPNPPGLGTANPLKLAAPLPVQDNEFNEIDAMADKPLVEDVIENRPFGVWEERVGGAFK